MVGWSLLNLSGAPRRVISWQKFSRPYFSIANRSDLLSGRLMTPGMIATACGPLLRASPAQPAPAPESAHERAKRQATERISISHDDTLLSSPDEARCGLGRGCLGHGARQGAVGQGGKSRPAGAATGAGGWDRACPRERAVPSRGPPCARARSEERRV